MQVEKEKNDDASDVSKEIERTLSHNQSQVSDPSKTDIIEEASEEINQPSLDAQNA